jgi:adenylate kinase
MLSLEVTEDELVARLLERGKTSGRKDDQDEETIRNRFRVYLRETEPLKYFYNKQNKLQTVDGMGSVQDIFDRLCMAIDA